MAAGLQFSGVKTLCPVSLRGGGSSCCLPVRLQRLHFASSVASVAEFSEFSNANARSCLRSRVLRVSCDGRVVDVLEKKETKNQSFGEVENQLTCVMKFGGSSVASAERMREVAELILSFPNEKPVIVLSAMGKTTNKLLLV